MGLRILHRTEPDGRIWKITDAYDRPDDFLHKRKPQDKEQDKRREVKDVGSVSTYSL